MLTTKRKVRNRKQFLLKVYFLVAVLLLSIVAAYFTSLKLFVKSGYLSPLSEKALADFAHEDDQAMTALQKSLSDQHIVVSSVTRQDETILIRLKDDSEVLLSTEKDIKRQVSSLQFILSQLTMEGKLFSQLDLRFDKPVIKLRK